MNTEKPVASFGFALGALLILVGTALGAVGGYLAFREGNPVRVTSMGPTVTELQRLSELAILRVHVADILTGEGETHKFVYLVKGDALLSVDLSKARITNNDDQKKTATLLPPAPRVVQARVDHNKAKFWDVTRTAWLPWKLFKGPDQIRDEVLKQAQKLVEEVAGGDENMGYSRKQAV